MTNSTHTDQLSIGRDVTLSDGTTGRVVRHEGDEAIIVGTGAHEGETHAVPFDRAADYLLTSRPVDRYYAGVIQQMRDIVTLSQKDEDEDVPADLAERLDVADIEYPSDTAMELADSMVYAVERLALVEDDDTVGELRSVELLLGGGGPTITLTAKMRDGRVRDVELWHSWGAEVGTEATARAESQADVETVENFLQLLGAIID